MIVRLWYCVAIRKTQRFLGKNHRYGIFRNGDPSGTQITFSPSGVEQFWCYVALRNGVIYRTDTSASAEQEQQDALYIHVGQELRTSQLVYTKFA